MYLKYIRRQHLGGGFRRGTLYRVHFQPNEKGGYNEHLKIISDVYEIGTLTQLPAGQPTGLVVPPPLIYSAGVRMIDGRMRVAFGIGNRRSILHLFNKRMRDAFFIELTCALHEHEEVRLEVTES